jgi:hypothetical protein
MFERVFARTLAALHAAKHEEFAHGQARFEDLSRFPSVLSMKKWESGRGFIPDLASLEYALCLIAQAPEIETRGFERVAEASEPDWYGARFRFDPGHCLLESEWPLLEAFEHPESLRERIPTTYLIYRVGGQAQFRLIGENEEALLRPLSLGIPLGRILERRCGPDFDAPIFSRWIESGLLRAIDWSLHF